jgi:hypothetical protein
MYEDDTSRRLAQVLAGVLHKAIEESRRYESGLPHVLVCTDGVTGEATFSGPFPSLVAAERVAEHERRCAGWDSSLMFHVSALYPPLDLEARGHDNGPTRLESAESGSWTITRGANACCQQALGTDRSAALIPGAF